MSLRCVFVLVLCILTCSVGVARADDLADLTTMLGLWGFPTADDRTVSVGVVPQDFLPLPQPTGLRVVGSASGSLGGKIVGDLRFYTGPEGIAVDAAAYERQLESAGWSPVGSVMAFSMPGVAQNFCKAKVAMVAVRTMQQYLVVRVDRTANSCATLPMAMRGALAIAKAPFPQFSAPEGTRFVGASVQTMNNVAQIATIRLTSQQAATSILAGFMHQMTEAGWTAQTQPTTGGDSQAFSVRDASGRGWLAALAVSATGGGAYIFTATAFAMEGSANATTALR